MSHNENPLTGSEEQQEQNQTALDITGRPATLIESLNLLSYNKFAGFAAHLFEYF